MEILIVGALRAELEGPVAELGFGRLRQGVVSPAREGVGLLWTGVGADAVARCAEAVRAAKPGRVLHVGFAGGLRAGLAEGDVVVVDAVLSVAEPDSRHHAAGFEALRNAVAAMRSRMAQGAVVTVPSFLHHAEAKLALGRARGAIACDMESSPLAQICAEAQIPWSGLRAISDAVDRDVLPLRGDRSMTRHLRALARPGNLLTLTGTLKGAARARRALKEAIPVAVRALR